MKWHIMLTSIRVYREAACYIFLGLTQFTLSSTCYAGRSHFISWIFNGQTSYSQTDNNNEIIENAKILDRLQQSDVRRVVAKSPVDGHSGNIFFRVSV